MICESLYVLRWRFLLALVVCALTAQQAAFGAAITAGTSTPTGNVEVQQLTSGGDGSAMTWRTGNHTWFGQTFTVGTGFTLDKLSLLVAQEIAVDRSQAGLTLSFDLKTATSISDSVGGSSVFGGAQTGVTPTFTQGVGTWLTMDVANVFLNPGVYLMVFDFAFLLDHPTIQGGHKIGDAGNTGIIYSEANPYAGGTAFRYGTDGAVSANRDLLFSVQSATVVTPVDRVWTNTANGNQNWSTAANWTNNGAPAGVDRAVITNNLGAGSTSVSFVDQNFTIKDLVATNTGAAVRNVTINNGLSLLVTNSTLIGSNTVLNVGASTTAGSTFSNQNLTLRDNGKIVIFGGAIAGNFGTLTVAGTFSNSAQSVISNVFGKTTLKFLANSPVTNNGTMAFLITERQGTGTEMFRMSIGTSSNNFFVNNGTFIMGNAGTSSGPGNAALYRFNILNQFINNGSMVITNGDNDPDSDTHRPEVTFTGTTGGASTNTGTIRLVSAAVLDSTTAPQFSLTISNGGFVNTGTVTVNTLNAGHSTASNFGQFLLTEANTTFSNAVGGQLIVESTSHAQTFFAVRAARAVNLGTNVVNIGTLFYQTAASGNGILENAGVVTLNGGNLVAAGGVTNVNGGVIRTTSGTGTLASALINTASGTVSNINGMLVLTSITGNNQGTITIGSGGLVQLGTTPTAPFALNNAGTVNLFGGALLSGNIVNLSGGEIRGGGVISNLGAQVANNAGAAITANDSGTALRFTNALTFGNFGQANITNGGTLIFGTATGSAVVTNAGTIFLANGTLRSANVTNTALGTVRGAGSLTSLLANLGTVDATNGTLFLNAGMTNTGIVNVRSGGTLNVGNTSLLVFTNYGTGNINLYGGTIVDRELINFGHIATVGNGGIISNALINMAGAYIDATNGVLELTPDLLNFGTITNSATLKINTDGLGTVTNGGAGLIRMQGGTFTSGTITNAATIEGFGTISGQILNVANGLVDATNGILRLFSAPINNSTMRAQTGGTLVVTNVPGAVLRDWSNAGTLEVRRGTVVSGNLTNTGTIIANQFGTSANGTISANVINNFKMFVTNGTMNLTEGLTNSNTGSVDVSADGTLSVSSLVNAGTVVLRNVIVHTNVNNSGTIEVAAPANTASINGAAFLNSGTVDFQSGTLNVVGPAGMVVTNLAGGTFRVGGTALRVGSSGAAAAASNQIYNAGALVFNAGTIASGAIINSGEFRAAHSGTGTITITDPSDAPFSNTVSGRIVVNSGTVVSSRTIVNLGVIDTYGNGVLGSSGGFTNTSGGVIINTNATATLGIRASANQFANFGVMVVSNGGTVNLLGTTGTGTEWENANIVRLGSPTTDGVLNSATINNNGLISGRGTINLSVGGNAPRPFTQGAGGSLVVSNGDLTITHLSNNRLSINGGLLQVNNGTTLRIFTDLAATTNAIFLNSANTVLQGGTIVSANVTNSATIRGFGALSFNNGNLPGSVSNLVNSGTIVANNASTPLVLDGARVFNQATGTVSNNNGRLLVTGVFTNAGTVTFLNSVGTFNGAVVNSGAWLTDPSTNTFLSSHTITSSGYIDADAQDVYIFRDNLINQSTQSNTWDTLNVTVGGSGVNGTKFIFDDDLANGTQDWFHAGILLTGGFTGAPTPTSNGVQFISSFGAVTGFNTNFSLGRLEIGNTDTNSILQISDSFTGDGNIASLFVNDLWLFGTSQLVISNNTRVYFVNSNDWDMANITLLGNAQIHQLQILNATPEPSTLFLMLSGATTAWWWRRRSRSRRR